MTVRLPRPSRRAALAIAGATTGLVVAPALVPRTGVPGGTDLLLHGLAGAVVAVIYAVVLDLDGNRPARAVLGGALAGAVLLGVGVEAAQAAVPGRLPAVADAVAHAAGAGLALVAYRAGHRLVRWG